jgi:hypothetical protein
VKPSRAEDEYFAAEEIEKLYRLAREQDQRQAATEREALRKAHAHKCPGCGHDLKKLTLADVTVARCFHCEGTFLEKGELAKLVAHAHGGDLAKLVAALAPPK